ncbi:MAG: MATE family efflux transporter [Phascolarctobacterium sp.]|uniref:MATE family efflux transporter n=1 Tax=Phascolarctobacterium sp. TaxID=2049039 RepID=UPI0026DA971C|nr:MATE family efflux transporter [Phascolarctobacterium sp.]MDO4920530.1 MATE family efflux transporter [Phascolarctobacterium sp.]
MRILTDKEYLGLTVPFMLSTMTQPLMGAVNTAVMGQLPDPKYIAAVSLGAILFNNLYWLFGFLRVSTTGYAAQAFGAADKRLGLLAFFKPLVLALLVSFFCIVLQNPIVDLYLGMIGAAPEVNQLCRSYYYILIWGAPLVLFNYVALGWLMGQTRVRASVFMQVSMNVLNMFLSVWFVFWLHMDIVGVALATLLSQLYGGLLGALLMYIYGDFDYGSLPWGELLDWRTFVGMLQVNANLMIRTACLLTVNNIIAAVGASLGTVVLAANAVLLQLKDIMSYLIDGMANGAAIFSGRAVGAGSKQLFNETISVTYKWLGVLAALLMGGYYLTSDYCIRLFTGIDEVITAAKAYDIYVLFYPVCAGIGMVLYGVFCGATYTAPIRNMMLLALGVFYLAQYFLVPLWGNSGLWLALLCFMLAQSVVLLCYLPGLKKKITQ